MDHETKGMMKAPNLALVRTRNLIR